MTSFNPKILNNVYKEALMYCVNNSINRTLLFDNLTKEPSQLLHGVIADIYPWIFLESHILYTLLSNCDKSYYEYNGYISAYIKSTREYQRLTNLYDDYITIIAKLIKENSDEIFDVATYYINLLHTGILSYNCGFSFRNLKTDYDNRLGILGARIASGFGVCRHMAMNLKDVYDKLGYNASYISCDKYNNKIDFQKQPNSKFKKQVVPKTTHAIVGVTNGRKSLIVDPTWQAIGRFDYPKKDVATLKYLHNRKDSPFYFHLDSEVTIKKGPDNYANYLKFLEHNNYFNNNSESLAQRSRDVSSKIMQNLLYYIEWNAKYQDLFKEIAELEKLLSCYKEIEVVRTRK